jgi:uncharacterized protein (TIGR03083 family)
VAVVTLSAHMTSTAQRTIQALRATHDQLAAEVAALSDGQLSGPSGASEWSVAQVLSHLGSGAEIGLATLRSALDGAPAPAQDFNQGVWDRWNALGPEAQAAGFLTSDEALVSALEGVPGDVQETLQIKLGFLPAPLPLAAYAGMRLNEAAHHSWDVRVSRDAAAVIPADIATRLAEHFATDIGFLLQFTGKADALAEPAVVDIRETDYAIVIADTVSLVTSAPPPTATFTGPLEGAVRLLAGRLTPRYTPSDVTVTGNLALDDLRRVFPGY